MPGKVSNNLTKKTENSGKFCSHISEVLSNFADRLEYAKNNPMTPEEFKDWSNK